METPRYPGFKGLYSVKALRGVFHILFGSNISSATSTSIETAGNLKKAQQPGKVAWTLSVPNSCIFGQLSREIKERINFDGRFLRFLSLDVNEDAEKRGGTGLSAPRTPNKIFTGFDRVVNAKTAFRLQALQAFHSPPCKCGGCL